MPRFVLQLLDEKKKYDEPTYWSNELGWVDLTGATVFLGMKDVRKPVDPCEWVRLPESFVVSTDSNDNWKDDLVQFARLIEEMQGCGLPDKGCEFEAVRLAMDLCQKDLENLFERARKLWEEAKVQI